jgi:hypothetical protein
VGASSSRDDDAAGPIFLWPALGGIARTYTTFQNIYDVGESIRGETDMIDGKIICVRSAGMPEKLARPRCRP